MTLDTVLNLVWLGIGVTALILFGLFEFRHRSSRPSWIFRRALAVFFAAVSLFPCVSASDDLFSFAFLQSRLGQHRSTGNTPAPPEDSQEKANLHLARILQALEHLQISGLYSLTVTFFCFTLIRSLLTTPRVRNLRSRAGRSPPQTAFSL